MVSKTLRSLEFIAPLHLIYLISYHIVSLFEMSRNVSTFWTVSIISPFHQPLMRWLFSYKPSPPSSLGCPFLPSAPYQAKNMPVPVEPNERIASLRRDHKRPAAHLKSCQRHKNKLQNMRKARSSSNQKKICSRIWRVSSWKIYSNLLILQRQEIYEDAKITK